MTNRMSIKLGIVASVSLATVASGAIAMAETVARHFGSMNPADEGWLENIEEADGAPFVGPVSDPVGGRPIDAWQIDTLSNGGSPSGGMDLASDEVVYRVDLTADEIAELLDDGWSLNVTFRPVAIDPDPDLLNLASFKVEELEGVNQIRSYPINVEIDGRSFAVRFGDSTTRHPVPSDEYTVVSLRDLDADGVAHGFINNFLVEASVPIATVGGSSAMRVEFGDNAGGKPSGPATPEAILNYREVSLLKASIPVCGNGIVETTECCDLGSANGPSSGCSTSCECQGCCVSNCAEPPPLECATAADCSGGSEGCCGNGILETGEACDDGNLDGGDCCAIDCTVPASCTPACPGVFGPQLLNPVSMKVRLRDLALDGEYERWTTSRGGKKGDMILRFGQDIDPSTEPTRLVFLENDGSNEVRQLGAFAIQPEDWTKCVEKPKGTDDGICKLKDKTETISDPDGVRTAIVKEKGAVVKYKFKGSKLGGILKPNTSQIRVCLYVGDDAGTSVLDCEEKGGGRLIKCDSTN